MIVRMKKMLVLILAFSVLILESEVLELKAETAGILGILEQWEKTAPDYYGGVRYLADKELFYVYLKENTEKNRKIVRDGIPEKTQVVFVSCAYSQNELKQVDAEILKNLGEYKGVQTFGVTTADLVSGRVEPRVRVGILKENYKVTSQKLLEKYGDKVDSYISQKEEAVPPAATDTQKSTVTPTVKIKNVKLAKKKITVKWRKLSAVSKYKIIISKPGKKTILTKVSSKTSFTYKVKGKVAKKYTIKVKAYHKKSKKWGAWTKTTLIKK